MKKEDIPKTPDYNWGSSVKLSDQQIDIAEQIKGQLTCLTIAEAKDVLTAVKEQLPAIFDVAVHCQLNP